VTVIGREKRLAAKRRGYKRRQEAIRKEKSLYQKRSGYKGRAEVIRE